MTDPRSTERPVGWRFLHSPRWLGYFTLFLIFSIACVLLGNWQFDRRAEARAEIERLVSNFDSVAVPLAEEVPDLDAFDEDAQKWRTVVVSGEYLDGVYLARNRPGPSSEGVGSDLIQALRADDGRVFFIDRGWVAVDGGAAERGDFDATALPAAPTGRVTVEARLRASEPAISGRSSTDRTVASIDLHELSALAGVEGHAYTAAYGMLVSEDPAGEHGTLPGEPEHDEGPHLSYALQWYVFIMIGAIGVAYAARREFRSLNAGSEAVAAQDRRDAERRRRRGPTDADEEDALLDA